MLVQSNDIIINKLSAYYGINLAILSEIINLCHAMSLTKLNSPYSKYLSKSMIMF